MKKDREKTVLIKTCIVYIHQNVHVKEVGKIFIEPCANGCMLFYFLIKIRRNFIIEVFDISEDDEDFETFFFEYPNDEIKACCCELT
jgi:hypothetical protein